MALLLGLVRSFRLGELTLFVASVALQTRVCGGRLPAAGGAAARAKRRARRGGATVAPEEAPAATPDAQHAAAASASAPAASAAPQPAAPDAPPQPPPPAAVGAEPGAAPAQAAPAAPGLAQVACAAASHPALGAASAALMGVHLLLEGARWQLLPLYCATGLAAAFERPLLHAPPPLRCAAAVACLLASATTAVASLAFPWFRLPLPTGPHPVGRVTRVLVDPSRGAWVTPDKGAPRRLLVDVWYPAAPGRATRRCQRCTYMDPVLATAMSVSFLGPRLWFVASHFSRVPTASRREAPAAAGGRHPVLVFSHGNVSTRVQNTSLMEDLASHGFVCVAMDHPFDAAVVAYPDGSALDFEWELPSPLDAPGVLAFRAAQVALRAGDVSAVLDWLADGADGPLAGLADVSRAAVAGHSFGGAAAARAAAIEPRLRAAVLLDAWQWPLGAAGPAAGLPVPSLLFESDAFLGDRDAFCAFNSRMSSEMALNSTRAWKVVARVGHYEYTDMALTAPLFMRALGLITLKPSQLVAFQRYQSAMVRSFLHEFVVAAASNALGACASVDEGGPCGAPAELAVPPSPRPAPPPSPGRLRSSSGAPPLPPVPSPPRLRRMSSHDRRRIDAASYGLSYGPEPPPWAPPRFALAAPVPREALAAEVDANLVTPSQRRAMRLLLQQIRRGDYEIWDLPRHAWESLPDLLALVIHTQPSAAIRAMLVQADAELRAEAAKERAAGRARRAAAEAAEAAASAEADAAFLSSGKEC